MAFTGGDDLVNPNWIKEFRASFEKGADIVAGKSIMMGLKAWEDLDRVELYRKRWMSHSLLRTWRSAAMSLKRLAGSTHGSSPQRISI